MPRCGYCFHNEHAKCIGTDEYGIRCTCACTNPDTPEAMADYLAAGEPNGDPHRPDIATCGTCGRSWDDARITSYTPTPAARCPFEAWHPPDED